MICANANCSNSTPKVQAFCFEKDEAYVTALRILAYSVVVLVSLVGNTLVLGVSVWQDRKMKRNMNYFIANMAVADLTITIVYMPRIIAAMAVGFEWLVGGTVGVVLCKLVPFLHHVTILVSVLSLVGLSFERYLAVATNWPRNILSERRTKMIIFLIWVVSLGVRLPHAIALTYKRSKGGDFICATEFNDLFGSSKARKLYDNLLAAIFYALPLALLIIFYTMAMLKLRKHRASMESLCSAQHSKRVRETNCRLFKMMLAVTTAFVLCWAAYFIARRAILKTRISCEVRFWRVFLAHTNSALTPCMYAFFSKKYRRGFANIIGRCCSVFPRIRRRSISAGLSSPTWKHAAQSGHSGAAIVLGNMTPYST